MFSEEWRQVLGHPHYEVSSLGRVRSLDRVYPHPRNAPATITRRGRVKQSYLTDRYTQTCIDGETVSLHTVVLTAFRGPPPSPDMECRHLNGVKRDCRESNLAWGTPHENQMDRFDHGTACAGEDNYRAVQGEAQVLRIMELHRSGLGPKAIAEAIGCERHHVKSVIYGQSWNWLTGLPRLRYRKASVFEPQTN